MFQLVNKTYSPAILFLKNLLIKLGNQCYVYYTLSSYTLSSQLILNNQDFFFNKNKRKNNNN